MPLTITGVAPGLSPIASARITQFYELLTGQMTDQQVTLKNRVIIGGNQSASGHTVDIIGVSGQAGHQLRVLALPGDTTPVWAVDALAGTLFWGPGGASALDTTLYRVAAGFLAGPSGFTLTQAATPAAPGASLSTFYFKSDGLPYYRSGAAGAETPMGGTNVTDPLVAQVFG